MGYAAALADWGDHGGYDAEVHWDECLTRAVGIGLREATTRPLRTFSGGEQKRIVLEVLLRGEDDILLLDEPDNFLDVPAKRWLERELSATRKTVLFVSHDRELLAATATKVITVEADGAWTHGGGFAGYAEARHAHHDKLARDRTWYDGERQRLVDLVAEMRRRAKISETFAPRLKAAESRLRQFEERNDAPVDGPPTTRRRAPRRGTHRQAGRDRRAPRARRPHRSVRPRAVVRRARRRARRQRCRQEPLPPPPRRRRHRRPHRQVATRRRCRPGLFHQTHEHPEWTGATLLDILHDHDVVRGPAMGMLRRYELHDNAQQPFETLSGGQQARFQILLLERSGATLLLLDEPTDNLDLVSAEALEAGLGQFTGTVIAVTHDRWFLRGFDRFVVFGADCSVTDHLAVPPDWR